MYPLTKVSKVMRADWLANKGARLSYTITETPTSDHKQRNKSLITSKTSSISFASLHRIHNLLHGSIPCYDYLHKLRLAYSDTCPMCDVTDTPNHVIIACPRFAPQRELNLGSPRDLPSLLGGNKETLYSLDKFLTNTVYNYEIPIWQNGTRKQCINSSRTCITLQKPPHAPPSQIPAALNNPLLLALSLLAIKSKYWPLNPSNQLSQSIIQPYPKQPLVNRIISSPQYQRISISLHGNCGTLWDWSHCSTQYLNKMKKAILSPKAFWKYFTLQINKTCFTMTKREKYLYQHCA